MSRKPRLSVLPHTMLPRRARYRQSGGGSILKLATDVSADKLRGGFYSPESLVAVCLDRVESLVGDLSALKVLEPSAGDGAFVAGLDRHRLARRVSWMTSVELIEEEAAVVRRRQDDASFSGEVINDSVLAWAAESAAPFDVAVGNPPFVRFQFVDPSERVWADLIAHQSGLTLRGVSNLWMPVLAAALNALRPNGVFSFIVPSECFTGISGHEFREWLLARVDELHVDLFAPGSFPGVLQEIVVLSGRMIHLRDAPARAIHLREHGLTGIREWTHQAIHGNRTWTRYLLSPSQVSSLDEALALSSVKRLGAVAKFEVATVTGANGFFCVNEQTLDRYDMWRWARPLLPRTRHATGLRFRHEDHAAIAAAGAVAYLLDFSATADDPLDHAGAIQYLSSGVEQELPLRYKCRIREPWFRVPVVAPGALMIAKRSHMYPRVVINEANVLTTDTIYRGRVLRGAGLTPTSFAAGFHNSLTLVTAEIEGRSFGGGVLELVPSEVSRLALPLAESLVEDVDRLDRIARDPSIDELALIQATDQAVGSKVPGLSVRLMDEVRNAYESLRALRIARTSSGSAPLASA